MINRWLDRIDRQRPAEPKGRKPRRPRAMALEQSQRPMVRRPTGARAFCRPAERHGHLSTSAHAQALYPWQVQAGLGPRGVIVGRQAWGGVFTFDQWLAYELGLTSDPNIIILGLLGVGKSSLAKTLCLRQVVFGRRVEVLDRKSEYRALMDALGGVVVRLEPGTRINPLERAIARESRESLLRAVARALLRRDLRPVESLALALALRSVDESADDVVTIPDVIRELRAPSAPLLEEMDLDVREWGEELREVTYALRGLETGPLAGLFDGPTTHGEGTWSRDAVSVDIEGLASTLYGEDESTAVALAIMATTAFLDGRRRSQEKKTIRLNDEAWRAIAVDPAYFAASLKLSRSSGVSTVFAVHRLSDLSASGDRGSREHQLATGLLAEISTRIIYRQSPHEIPATVDALGLSDTEAGLLPTLGKGQALWHVGSRGYLVQHQVTAAEWPLIDTDALMREAA